MPPESEVDILLCAPLEVIQVVIKMEAVPLCTCAACLMDGEPHAGSFGVCVTWCRRRLLCVRVRCGERALGDRAGVSGDTDL